MEARYKEVMDHVVLTEEAKSRILSGVVTRRKSHRKQWTALAACLAVILIGSLTLQPRRPMAPVTSARPPLTAAPPEIRFFSAAEDLEQAAGFSLEALPLDPEQTVWKLYPNGTAEALSTWEGGTAILQKSTGAVEDFDPAAWETVLETEARGCTVLLGGTAEGYQLAAWTDGTYAWSLRLSGLYPEEFWTELLEQLA